MSMSMVSRRVVGFTKGKRKSSAPKELPRLGRDELIGEPARHFAPLAVRVAPKPQAENWLKKRWVKGLALLISAIACSGLGYLAFKSNTNAAYETSSRYERSSARAASSHRETESTFGRPSRVTVSAGGREIGENPAHTERATLTDQSFLATAYVRRKVSLPNISGECTVKGNGSLDVGECLRQQE